MSDARRAYEFDNNAYERPNQAWQCGRQGEGICCPLGPTQRGTCQAVCTPYRDGDRYYCGSASILGGRCELGPKEDGSCCHDPAQCSPAKRDGRWVCMRGACMVGPLPDGKCSRQFEQCSPIRNVITKRKLFTLYTTAACLAGCLIMLASPMRQEAASPGPLTAAHQQNKCVDCHVNGDGTLTSWVRSAFHKDVTPEQSETKCLRCHDRDLGENPRHPHSLDPVSLQRLTAAGTPSNREAPAVLTAVRSVLGKPSRENDQFECSTCHQEHHGKSHDLSFLTDLQCQMCHQQTFASLENGHPEFSNYPYFRRTRIYFDHNSHYQQHFANYSRVMPNGVKPDNCMSCHELDPSRKKMLVRNFEQTCASCHQDQIEKDIVSPQLLFAIPRVDLATLLESDARIGEWPALVSKTGEEESPPDFVLGVDGLDSNSQLPALMQLLLETDPRFSENRDVAERLNLQFLSSAGGDEPDEVQAQARLIAVEQYLWSIKELVYDLAQHDSSRLEARLAPLVPEPLVATRLIAELDPEPFRRAAEQWFPSLAEEIAAIRPQDGQTVEHDALPETEAVTLLPVIGSADSPGWNLKDRDLTVRFKASGHADSRLRRLLDAVGDSYTGPTSPEPLRKLFHDLVQPASTGRCLKCHTADQDQGAVNINWVAARPTSDVRSFTHFSHDPHLTVMGQDNCESCHRQKGEVDRYRDQFMSANWTLALKSDSFSSDFEHIQVQECANCHRQGNVQHSCLTCHNYHVRQRLAPDTHLLTQ